MNNLLRKLARSHQWQSLYVRCKDIGTLKLFTNDSDLSETQRHFLMWLEVYNSLYMDLRMEEDFISNDVIEDDIRCEAYLLYKSKKRDTKKEEKENKKVDTSGNIPTVIFKRK